MTLKKLFFGAALCAALFGFAACSSQEAAAPAPSEMPKINSLNCTGSLPLTYARQFRADLYEGGYAVIDIKGDGSFLLVPEGGAVPEDLPDDMRLLQQPLSNIYLAGSACMDMFIAMDGLEDVAFSALDQKSWYLPEAAEAMKTGSIHYAGKYSAPDYELLLSGNCRLAVENSMIYHTPEVKEQLEANGIPVLVDHSSFEAEPLGRSEWVKLYGLLTGRLETAEQAFEAQRQALEQISEESPEENTVAYFYITSAGGVNVRRSTDYLAKMIAMAGGEYVFKDLGSEGDSATSTITIGMEEFYAAAHDADFLIYNSTIDAELGDIGDLLAKSNLLADFKAVQNGHVYCTAKNLYQSSMALGDITADIHHMLLSEDDKLTYLYRVE